MGLEDLPMWLTDRKSDPDGKLINTDGMATSYAQAANFRY